MQETLNDILDVRFDGSDVLVFRRADDGTVAMLAVTSEEWAQAVAAGEPCAPQGETARRLFAREDAPVSQSGGSSTSRSR